jgi:hypothetical protein
MTGLKIISLMPIRYSESVKKNYTHREKPVPERKFES